MPLNDALKKRTGRLSRLGVIRLGWQEPNASGRGDHPVASDHFVLTDAQYLARFFGDEPTELPIHFPYAHFDRNIEGYHRVWAGGGASRKSGVCVCQGDGDFVNSALPFRCEIRPDKKGVDRAHVYREPGDWLVDNGVAQRDFAWNGTSFKDGDTVPCPGSDHDAYPHCKACRPSVVLKVMIRDKKAARFGYYQISTTSISNYMHFRYVWDSITNDGQLPISMSDVPFILRIAPGSTMYQDDSKMWTPTERFFLQLELDPRIAQAQMESRERRFEALLEGRPDPMLTPRLPSPIVTLSDDMPDSEDAAPPPWAEADYDDEPTGDPFLNGNYRDHPMDADEREARREMGDLGEVERKAWPSGVVAAIVDAHLAANVPNTVGMLNLSTVLTPSDELALILEWANHYRNARADHEPKEAAALADERIAPVTQAE